MKNRYDCISDKKIEKILLEGFIKSYTKIYHQPQKYTPIMESIDPPNDVTNLTNITSASIVTEVHANIEKYVETYVNDTSQEIYKAIQKAVANREFEARCIVHPLHKNDTGIIQLCNFFTKRGLEVQCINYGTYRMIVISWKKAYDATYPADNLMKRPKMLIEHFQWAFKMFNHIHFCIKIVMITMQ